MSGPWLLMTTATAAELAPLVAAARELGLRVGWLELSAPTPPPPLAEALEAGCAKAVELGPNGSLAAKARRGPAVLRDVLREHFPGTGLVLVRGDGLDLPKGTPRLEVAGEGFALVTAGGEREVFTAEQLAARMRKPSRRPGRRGRPAGTVGTPRGSARRGS